MATEDRWHDFAKEKPSEDMEGRNFIVSNGYSDTLSMWCGGYWENEPFMGSKLCDEVVRWKGYLTPEEEKANEATRTELKADKTFVFGEECEAYKKSDVDELLAEKDAAIAELKKQLHDLCAQSMDVSGKTIDKVSELMAENERLKNEPCNDGEKCNAYWKLYAENESLKKEISDITDGFCDSTHTHIEELRHQKYKRCLDKAELCKSKRIDAANYRITREKWEFYDKWHKRWLELAKKFKEGK